MNHTDMWSTKWLENTLEDRESAHPLYTLMNVDPHTPQVPIPMPAPHPLSMAPPAAPQRWTPEIEALLMAYMEGSFTVSATTEGLRTRYPSLPLFEDLQVYVQYRYTQWLQAQDRARNVQDLQRSADQA